MSEEEAHKTLLQVIKESREVISRVSSTFRQPWYPNITTRVRAVFGKWMTTSVRHLSAITILAEEHDLSMVSEVHYRQMFEIMLQVRYLAMATPSERELLAQKISASGCIDYIEKLKPFKDMDFGKKGYQEELEQLEKYDKELVASIYDERARHIYYWFGKSFDQLARKVSRTPEDLAGAYHIISADIHGSWDITLAIANPEPGKLDFRGYPDLETLYTWATEQVDRSTGLYIQIWNEIAKVVGAQKVVL